MATQEEEYADPSHPSEKYHEKSHGESFLAIAQKQLKPNGVYIFDEPEEALFVFLNKHCFNGLYRVNGQGMFNVPYNNSVKESCSKEAIVKVSKSLRDVVILEGDFQQVCDMAKEGDFVFIDSPYAPLNPASFESYTKEGFDVGSHERLARAFKEMTARGCYCMLTNHNTEFINGLYADFKREVVDVKRMINSDARKRVGQEVIITNY